MERSAIREQPMSVSEFADHSSDRPVPDYATLHPGYEAQLSNPVGTFFSSLASFMPAASAMVSIRAAKSFAR
jgi:hypothetical protein